MKLESLTIRAAHDWEKLTGYTGEITLKGPLGKIQIHTSDELSRRILQMCADEITASIIEQSSALATALGALDYEAVYLAPEARRYVDRVIEKKR